MKRRGYWWLIYVALLAAIAISVLVYKGRTREGITGVEWNSQTGQE